jgi:hypothetical protein
MKKQLAKLLKSYHKKYDAFGNKKKKWKKILELFVPWVTMKWNLWSMY